MPPQMRMASASMPLVSSSLLMLLGGCCIGTAFTSNWPAGMAAATAQRKPCHRGAAHHAAVAGGGLRLHPRQVASPDAEAFSLRFAGLLTTTAVAFIAARGGRRRSQKTAVRGQAKEHQGTAKSATGDLEVMHQKLEIAWRAAAQAPDPTALGHAEPSLNIDAELQGQPRLAEASPRDVLDGLAACAGKLWPLVRLAMCGILFAELYKLASTGMHTDGHHSSSLALSLVLWIRLLQKDRGR
mmetsp:Transcript_27767/g.86472  ORF Transcript_27767/g.86472 Transcript_27767/m.86472 type:complete len:241 (-) Transcript_27767:292-1014(-)